MANPARNCPVCASRDKEIIFRQEFGRLSEGSLLAGYDLAVCLQCGAAYADDIPAQGAFDRYYAEMSKYEHIDRSGIQAETDLQRFKEVTDMVAPYLDFGDRLLDIGCATGGLLAELKKRGFRGLMGVDPSETCARITTRIHGIPSRTLKISELHQLGEQFDAIFLTGVLEHLRDVTAALAKVTACLRVGGLMYLEVPDATRYDRHFSAPFQFFSMEHVNYFSPTSLRNLLTAHGCSCLFTERTLRHLGPKALEPTIAGLFRFDSRQHENVMPGRDRDTAAALQRYIAESRTLERCILEKIDALVRSGRPLAVWGTGTHTLRLIETSRLLEARVVAFIDSNPHYQGKTLSGIPVMAPSEFSDRDAEILISSHAAEEEILLHITGTLHWPNRVHRLYEKLAYRKMGIEQQ